MMKRIALIVTCLVAVLAGQASAAEITIPLRFENAGELHKLLTGELPEWRASAYEPTPGLPAGVEEIEVWAAENAIHATGTEAGIGALRELIAALDVPRAQIEVATIWLDLDDPSVLGQALAVDEPEAHIAPPQIAVFPRMTAEEAAALVAAGTVLNEPRIALMDGMPGQIRFEMDTDDDGADDVGTGLGCVARVLPDDLLSLQMDLWTYDRRAEADEPETSLRVLLRLAEGETVALARVGEDGAILNPVHLVTARIVRDRPVQATD